MSNILQSKGGLLGFALTMIIAGGILFVLFFLFDWLVMS